MYICNVINLNILVMVNEIWRDIKGYEQLYQISNLGNVKSLNYNKTSKEKILKPNNIKGYLIVGLYKNGKRKFYHVHRLVTEAFLPNPNNKPCIDHINADRTDNRVENLRWVTHKENNDNPITKNKHFKKLKENFSKPIIQFSKDGEFIRKWNSAMDVHRELGINQNCICQCCKGKYKTAGGYIWRYYYKGIWMKTHIQLKDKKVV